MKKFLSILCLAVLLTANIAYAESNKRYSTGSLYINNQEYKGEVPVIIVENTPMIPIKSLKEFGDVSISWDNESQSVLVKKYSKKPITINQIVKEKQELSKEELWKVAAKTIVVNSFDHKGQFLTKSTAIKITNKIILTSYLTLHDAFTFNIEGKNKAIQDFENLDLKRVDKELDFALINVPDDTDTIALSNIEVTKSDVLYLLGSPLSETPAVKEVKVTDIVELNEKSYLKINYKLSKEHLGSAIIDKYGELVGMVVEQLIDGEKIYLISTSKNIKDYLTKVQNTTDDVIAIVYESGATYVGEINELGERHGYGKIIYCDGGAYQGIFRYNQEEGLGEIYYDSGNTYVGLFKDRIPYGYGIYTWANGDRYKGLFEKGKFSGIGCFEKKDGSIQYGTMKKDSKNGVFIEVDKMGRVYYVIYRNDKEVSKKFVKVTQAYKKTKK